MKSILLIGLGRFGRHVAEELIKLGHEVMAVDCLEERVNEILPLVTDAQIGDSTNEAFLESIGVDDYDVCFVAIGHNFQSSLETTSLLKELHAKIVVSRAERDVQAKFLLRNGADHVVYPEKQMGKWAAVRYTSNHILDYIELDDDNSIFEVSVPPAWIGKSIGDLDIRKKHNINILAVKQNGKMNVSLTPETILTDDGTIFVLGEYNAIQKCFKEHFKF